MAGKHGAVRLTNVAQKKEMVALFLAMGMSLSKVAKSVGVSPQTVAMWRAKDEGVQQAVERMTGVVRGQLAARYLALSGQSLTLIQKAMKDPSAPLEKRVSWAFRLLELSSKTAPTVNVDNSIKVGSDAASIIAALRMKPAEELNDNELAMLAQSSVVDAKLSDSVDRSVTEQEHHDACEQDAILRSLDTDE